MKEQTCQAIEEFQDGFYKVRDCSLCNESVGYLVHEGVPCYLAACDCRPDHPDMPCSRAEFSKFLKRQDDEG